MRRYHIGCFIVFLVFALTLSGCSDEMVDDVENKINNIGTVCESTGEQLKEIEQAYNALSDEQKEKVDNYEQYLTITKEYESYMRVLHVKNRIDSIEEISLDTKDVLDEIRQEYSSLTEEEKGDVDNYERLESLEKEVDQYIQTTVDPVVRDLTRYSYEEREGKEEVLFQYYNYMTDEQKKECLGRYLFYRDAPDDAQQAIKDALKVDSLKVYYMEVSDTILYLSTSDSFSGSIDITYRVDNPSVGKFDMEDKILISFTVDLETQEIQYEHIMGNFSILGAFIN